MDSVSPAYGDVIPGPLSSHPLKCGRWIHHTTGVGGNLLDEGVARYYGVKQYAKLAPGGLAYPGSGPANATTGRTGSGIPPAGVGVLRFGVDLMALTASQALDDSRRYVS